MKPAAARASGGPDATGQVNETGDDEVPPTLSLTNPTGVPIEAVTGRDRTQSKPTDSLQRPPILSLLTYPPKQFATEIRVQRFSAKTDPRSRRFLVLRPYKTPSPPASQERHGVDWRGTWSYRRRPRHLAVAPPIPGGGPRTATASPLSAPVPPLRRRCRPPSPRDFTAGPPDFAAAAPTRFRPGEVVVGDHKRVGGNENRGDAKPASGARKGEVFSTTSGSTPANANAKIPENEQVQKFAGPEIRLGREKRENPRPIKFAEFSRCRVNSRENGRPH